MNTFEVSAKIDFSTKSVIANIKLMRDFIIDEFLKNASENKIWASEKPRVLCLQ